MEMDSQKPKKGKDWKPVLWLPLLFLAFVVLWRFFVLASDASMHHEIIRKWVGDGLVMGCYIALMVTHLVLFLILKSHRANLFFSLACLTWLLRTGMTGYMFTILEPTYEWLSDLRIEYTTLPVMGVLLMFLFRVMFPGVLHKWFLYITSVLLAAICALFLFTEAALFEWTILGFVLLFVVVAIYVFIRFILKLRNLRPEQLVFLAGTLIMMIGLISRVLRPETDDGLISLIVRFLIQNDILTFIFFTSIALLISTTRAVREFKAEEHRVAALELIAESQLGFQREQYMQLMERVESVKYMRHDVRHHFAVISEYAQNENLAGIRGYMEGLEYGLSSSKGIKYCDNYAVNAIVTHYLGMAEGDGIEVTVKLNVPRVAGQVWDSELCVIVGNFLENAVAACANVAAGRRFIRLFSYIQDDALTFSMENSFDGEAKEHDGVFYSRKREGDGIGLASVKAVAAKYGGVARFEARGRTFISSVYVDMGGLENV